MSQLDPCTKYAQDVLYNRIKAGQHVRNACRRHLEALEKPVRKWVFDPSLPKRFVDLCSYLTVLEDGSKPISFVPLPYQMFIIGNIYGWIASKNHSNQVPGTRKYQECILFTAKGMGKTPLAGAASFYHCGMDGYKDINGNWIPEVTPQGYVTATVQEQAVDLGIQTVIDLLNDNEDLINTLKIDWGRSQEPKKIKFGYNRGILKALSTKRAGTGKSGYRVSYIHAEEIHEWTSGVGQLDMLKANFKNRPQPMMYLCSNSGNNMTGPAWDYRCKATEAAKTDRPENVFGYIAECDPEDLPKRGSKRWWPARRHWYKANPALNVITKEKYIDDRVKTAFTLEDRNEVLRLNFGIWPGDAGKLFERRAWDVLLIPPKKELPDPDDCELYMSIDLAQRDNFSAIGELYVPFDKSQKPYMRYEFWTPIIELQDRNKRSTGYLLEWVDEEWIRTCDASRISYTDLGKYIQEKISVYHNYFICADPTYMGVLESDCRKEGIPIKFLIKKEHYDKNFDLEGEIPVFAHNQYARAHTYSKLGMDASISDFKKLVKEGLCEIEDNPVTNWCLECVIVVEDENSMLKLSKRTSTKNGKGTDDGITVSVMCSGLYYKNLRDRPEDHWLEGALLEENFQF